MSLYTKYRPQSFSHLVGQDLVRHTLLHEIKHNSLTHAYLFCGPRGTGKTSSARLVAKGLNCPNKAIDGEPCDSCPLCISIREGNLIDVLEIDAASNRGIDEIRDLKEKIDYAPSLAQHKVYIIDEVHMLTKEAFNALLKTLEEPPENVYFILCTTEIHKIPETIISRCQRFDFKRIDIQIIIDRLAFIAQEESITIDPEALELIAHHVEGGLRDAIGLLEQLTIDKKLTAEHVRMHLGITGNSTIKKLVDMIVEKNTVESLKIINAVHTEGFDLATFTRELLEYLRKQLIDSIHTENGTTAQWLDIIEHLEKARDTFKTSIIPELSLEIAIIKICVDNAIPNSAKTQVSNSAENAIFFPVKPDSTTHATIAEENTVAAITHEMVMLEGSIGEHWQRIIEHINPPSLRRSLTQCSITEDEKTLTLIFRARFHMEKVTIPTVRTNIEKTIKELFGRTIAIKCELAITPALHDERKKMSPLREEASNEEKSPTPGITEKAIEMFNEW